MTHAIDSRQDWFHKKLMRGGASPTESPVVQTGVVDGCDGTEGATRIGAFAGNGLGVDSQRRDGTIDRTDP